MLKINNRVVIVCHCILNQSTRAWWRDDGASREEGYLKDVISFLGKYDVGIIQVECPEYNLYGNPRSPKSKDEYDTPDFRAVCCAIAEHTVNIIKKYQEMGQNPSIGVLAILGFEGSPSCGVERTTCTLDDNIVECNGPGLFIEILSNMLVSQNIQIPFLGMSLRKGERNIQLHRLEELLRARGPHSSQ